MNQQKIIELQLALAHVRVRVQVLTQMAQLGIMAGSDAASTVAHLRAELEQLRGALDALRAG